MFYSLFGKKDKDSGCWQRSRQRFIIFTFSRASLVLPFLAVFRGKSEIFGVPNFGQKRQKKTFFFK